MPKKKYHSDQNFIKKNRFLLFFLLGYLVLSVLLFDPKISSGGDNAVYMILTESMISGKGYRDIHLPEEPHHTLYPFGFPLLLVLPMLIFGRNVFIFKLLILLAGLGMMYFIYAIGRHLFKEKINIMLSFCLSIPIFTVYNHWILTEIPYLCLSLGAVYFFLKASTDNRILYYISFFLATYATFIRTVGVALVISMVLILILKKQFKYAGILAVMFLLIFIPWQTRNAGISHEAGYIEQLLAKYPYDLELGVVGFSDFVRRVWNNLIFYSFLIIPTTMMPIIKSGMISIGVGSFLVMVTVLGLITRLRKMSVIELYFMLSCVILLAWPTIWSSKRLLLPFLPLFIIYFYYGLVWLGKKVKFRHLIYVITVIFLVFNVISLLGEANRSFTDNISYIRGDKYAGYRVQWRHYCETVDWVGQHISKNCIIMARKPEFVYIMSGHKSLAYPFSTDSAIVKTAIEQSDFIIFDNVYQKSMARRWLLPVLEQDPEKYRIVYNTEELDFYVIRVLK
jgi:hypothetical protein